MHRYRIRVHYPDGDAQLTLCATPDWTRVHRRHAVAHDGDCHEFLVDSPEPYLYFKPRLESAHGPVWSQGPNQLAVAASGGRDVYPYFGADQRCAECELVELAAADGRTHRLRVFYPPGYWENTLQRFPVLYMHDGQNLFFPGEAYGGQHWRIAETLRALDAMSALAQVIVVGLYPNQRELDYTAPGYEAYARYLIETVKPWVDRSYRTLPEPRHTGTMGASLGGVVSLALAWQHPEVFGCAASLSSTFGWRDDLRERIAREPRPPVRLYLDSGWPNDNYEVTRDLRALLVARGFREGHDLHYFAFPEATHDERSWAMRVHLPFQLFYGAHPAPAPIHLDDAARAPRDAQPSGAHR